MADWLSSGPYHEGVDMVGRWKDRPVEHTDLTAFVVKSALRAAKSVIEKAEHLTLSERDSLRVLEALENPATPNARLMRAARDLPKAE